MPGYSSGKIAAEALKAFFIKLAPATQAKNPVMLLVYISAILTTILAAFSLCGIDDAPFGFTAGIAAVLWLTSLFANFAEAIAEGRGKAQADSLRASRRDVTAHLLSDPKDHNSFTDVASAALGKGDLFIVHAGKQIPADGDVVEGAASVDESAITGESAPSSAKRAATAAR